jgi:hypothetical protein
MIRPGPTKEDREKKRVQLASKRYFSPISASVEELQKADI